MHPFQRKKRKAPLEKVALENCPRCDNHNVHLTQTNEGRWQVRCGWGLVGCGALFTATAMAGRLGAAEQYNLWAQTEVSHG